MDHSWQGRKLLYFYTRRDVLQSWGDVFLNTSIQKLSATWTRICIYPEQQVHK